jgi:hypothetical protein
MTKKEAVNWLATSLQRCHHGDKAEVVYRQRMYPICKACFGTTVTAFKTVGEFRESKTPDAAYAYTVQSGVVGYQAEIFHAEKQATFWASPWYTTKQEASTAARARLKAMRQCTVERLLSGTN